jgi:hypothetical protein
MFKAPNRNQKETTRVASDEMEATFHENILICRKKEENGRGTENKLKTEKNRTVMLGRRERKTIYLRLYRMSIQKNVNHIQELFFKLRPHFETLSISDTHFKTLMIPRTNNVLSSRLSLHALRNQNSKQTSSMLTGEKSQISS